MGEFTIFLALVVTVLAVVWVLMPRAVIGIKPLLRQLIEQQKRTNQLLTDLRDNRPK